MTNEAFLIFPVLACVVLARFLVPALEKAEKAAVRFAIAALLFVLYTVTMLTAFQWYWIFADVAAMSSQACLRLMCVVFLLVNAAVLFGAFLFFVTREKRKLSETEKMKLKDL